MRRKLLFSLLFCVMIFVSVLNAQLASEQAGEKFCQLRELVKISDANWRVAETSMSRISLLEFQNRLGLIVGNETGRERLPQDYFSQPDSYFKTPDYVNWVEKGGVTPVKNQGHCGSCYAFASCALLESYYLRHHHQTLNLSEQYFMMKTKVGNFMGGCKGHNLWVCAATCMAFGAPEEKACPYQAKEVPCPKCKKKYRAVCMLASGVKGFQRALVKHGPIVVGYMVYEDFRNYAGGVYKYVHGKFLGGHAVLVVGYNKKERYWIVKNSWGSNWGESCDGKDGERGYFRIAFGQCMIESALMGPFYAIAPGSD